MIEALKQMVEALEWCHGGEPIGTAEAIKAGKQAIAELESQEPVKIAHRHEWFSTGEMKVGQMRCISCGEWGQKETPQRTWVGLTRDEQSFIYSSLHSATSRKDSFWVDFANAIEAKLKVKNI